MKRAKGAIGIFLFVWMLCIAGLSMAQQEAEAESDKGHWLSELANAACGLLSDGQTSTPSLAELCDDEDFKRHLRAFFHAMAAKWGVGDLNRERVSYKDSAGNSIAMSMDWWIVLQADEFCKEY